MWFIDPVLRRVYFVVIIRIHGEGIRIDYLIWILASNDWGRHVSGCKKTENSHSTECVLKDIVVSTALKVSSLQSLTPTTSHCPSDPKRSNSLPRSCTNPATYERTRCYMKHKSQKWPVYEPASTQASRPFEWLQPSGEDARSVTTTSAQKMLGQNTCKWLWLTSGSDSSTSVFSISMASQIPIRARDLFLKLTRACILNFTVCFSAQERQERMTS